MTEPTIAECKTRLEAEGFLVIPKGRVAPVRCSRSVATYMLAEGGFRDSMAPSMARDLAHHMIRNNCFTLDHRECEGPGWSPNVGHTVFELNARVILPKPSGP